MEEDQYFLEKAPMVKALMHLCVPMMLAMSANVVYSIINAYFIGTLNNVTLLSAIALALPVLTLTMAVGGVFGVGSGSYISRLLGEKRTDEIKHVSAFAFYGSLLSGVLLALIRFLLLSPLLHVLGTDRFSYGPTESYVSVLLLWLPVSIASFAMEQIVRAIGATKQSMYGMVVGIGTNLLFDVLLILVVRLGVAGAALAIGLSNLASLLYYIIYLQSSGSPVSVSIVHFRCTKTILTETFSIGISELIMSSFLIVTTLLFNNFAAEYGDDVIAAFGVAQRIVQLPEFLCMGIAMGIMPVLGFAYGSQLYKRLQAALKYSFVAIFCTVAVFSTTVYLFRSIVFSWFSSSQDVISLGATILTAMLVSSLFNGVGGLILAYFQTTNKPVQTTVLSVLQGSLFIPIILVMHAFFGLTGIIWTMTITEALTCLVGAGLFTFSQGKHARVVL